VTNFPLIRTPLPVLCLVVLYVTLVFSLKKFMANRPPFALKKALIFHNLTLFSISCFMVFEISRQAYVSGFGIVCNPIDRTESGIGVCLSVF
jgi:elongation of very long chain fatty acids protein 4